MRTGAAEEPPKRAEVFGPTSVAAPPRGPKPVGTAVALGSPVADFRAR